MSQDMLTMLTFGVTDPVNSKSSVDSRDTRFHLDKSMLPVGKDQCKSVWKKTFEQQRKWSLKSREVLGRS